VEAEFRRPDLAEQHATDRRINDFLFGIAESGFLPSQDSPSECGRAFHAVVAVGVNDFFLRAEQRQFVRVGRCRLAGSAVT